MQNSVRNVPAGNTGGSKPRAHAFEALRTASGAPVGVAGHVGPLSAGFTGVHWIDGVVTNGKQLPSGLRRACTGVALAVLAIALVQQLDLSLRYFVTWRYYVQQDLPVMLPLAALLACVAWWGLPRLADVWAESAFVSTPAVRAGVIAAAAVAVIAGTHLVAFDFAFSRDEIMALFDASLIANGELLGPVRPEWRPFVPALQPVFRLPVPEHAAWASTYLPGNAAIRGLLGLVLDRAFVNATLLVVALVALVGVARRMWPGRPEASLIALVLVATSSQTLFMSMTPYAMSAHLALNLVWLWLFLRNTAASHAAAIAVGFIATGLHQIVFHPLFVAPFIIQALFDRRWALAVTYGLAYAGIGLFWILYWQLLLAGTGSATPEAATTVGLSYWLDRVGGLVANMYPSAFETMVQNLFRFAAWQNPLMLVLIGPGLVMAWQAGGVARSLVGGIILTLVAMLILLPYQDYGWGYRYAHGLIGSAALVATIGWLGLTANLDSRQRRAAIGFAGVATAAAVMILVPVHGTMMRGMYEPYVRADAAIRAKPAGAVVVETIAMHYGDDLVRNDRTLSNRPLTFSITQLDEPLARELCRRFDVAVFTGAEAQALGVPAADANAHSERIKVGKLRTFFESDQCRKLRKKTLVP